MLLPGNAGSSFNRGFDPAQAGCMLNQPQPDTYSVGVSGVAAHVERDDRAKSFELSPRGLVSWMAGQAGIARQRDVLMQREALRECWWHCALRALAEQPAS